MAGRAGFGPAVLLLAVLLIAVVLGGLAAILPMGFYLRMLLPLLALGGLFLAWVIRSNNNVGFPRLVYAGLLLLVALSVLWPRYLFIHKAGLPGVNPFTLLTMGMLLLVIGHLLAVPSFSKRVFEVFRAGRAIGILVLLWFAWRFFSTAFGKFPVAQEIDLLKEIVYVGSFFLFALVLGSHKNGSHDVVRVLVLCGLIVGAVGLVEGFLQRNPFVDLIPAGADSETSTVLAGIASNKIRDGVFRAQSTFGHPIVLAQYIAAMVPISIYCALYDNRKIWRVIGLLFLPIALAAIGKSGSRAGIVSVLLACGATGFVWWLRALIYGRISKLIALLALPAMIVFSIVAFAIISELAGGRSQHEISSSNARIYMFTTAVSALWGSPLVGFGHAMALGKAGLVGAGGVVTLDNYYLNISLDYGYVGLVLFFTFSVVYLFATLRRAIANQGRDGALLGAFFAGVISLIATFSALSISENMTLFWLSVGLSFSVFRLVDEASA